MKNSRHLPFSYRVHVFRQKVGMWVRFHAPVSPVKKKRLSTSRIRTLRFPYLFQDCRSTRSTTYKNRLILYEINYKYNFEMFFSMKYLKNYFQIVPFICNAFVMHAYQIS